jgi:hypothetical protein
MCDFEHVISLFPCFSGTDVKTIILQYATPKLASMVMDDQLVHAERNVLHLMNRLVMIL